MAKNSFKAKNSLNLEPQTRPSSPDLGDMYFDAAKNTVEMYNGYWSSNDSKVDVSYSNDMTSTNFTSSITENSVITISGSPSAAFNIHGLVRNTNGKQIFIYNNTNQKMVFKNNSSTETVASAKITTPSGNDLSIPKKKSCTLFYDDSTQRWFANESAGGGGTSFDATQAAHGFSVLTPIYHDGTQWQKAQANTANTLAMYVVTDASTNAFTATKFGAIEVLSHGLTVGEYYYTSTVTAGAITSTEPLFGYSNPVLYVVDSSTVHIMCYRPSLIGDGNISDSEIGAVMAFPFISEPAGFLYADGRAVSRTTYNELFNVIGTKFGQGDGSTTFKLPDYRGFFLRGAAPTLNATFLPAAVNTTSAQITVTGHGLQHSGVPIQFSSTTTLPSPLAATTTYYAIIIDDNTIKVATSHGNALAGIAIALTTTGSGTHTIVQWIDPDASSRYAQDVGGSNGNTTGTIEDDAFKSHTHTSQVPAGGLGSGSTGGTTSGSTGATGGNETRPLNSTVGYFIRYAARGAVKGQDPLMEIFATTITGASTTANGILYYRVPKTMKITKASITLFTKGSASGTLTIDVKYNSSPNPTGMTTILTTPLTMNVSAASDYAEQSGSPNSAIQLTAGQWLRLDITSIPTSMGDFYISVYGE
jgi:microcystin-dependent protein